MRHFSRRLSTLMVFAPVLAVWTFLGLTSSAVAQDDAGARAQQYSDQTLRVSLWLDKDADQVYRRGEPVQITFQANEDAYAVIYHIDVEGRVDILWPTSRFSDGFVFGGHQYRLPSREGNRLRVGEAEGVGYVQAVVSRYPFDLRDLALDFHHENGDHAHDYYVAGDPFLAMNEVNYAVTGLEDAGEFVITNYVSYYVHRQVEHPRYLCYQCHDTDVAYEPYRDTCAVSIHYDYGWMNEWWGSYGFYPAYYYPTYYYVDPWTHARWVNYWYDPWYRWPVVAFYDWRDPCYSWHYSPYWRSDSWTANEQGNRRYTPLDRSTLGRDRDGSTVRTKNELVTGERPGDDRIRRMRDRVVTERDSGRLNDQRGHDSGPAGGVASDVSPMSRSQARFEPSNRLRTSPGLQLPGQTTATRTRDGRESRTVSTPVSRVRQDTRRSDGQIRRADDRQTIRPVEPRGDSGRVWSNRRNTGSPSVRPKAPVIRSTKPSTNRSSTIRRSSEPRSSVSKPHSSGGSRSTVRQPTRNSTPKPSSPPPSRSRSGGSSGGSRGSKGGSRSSGGRG